MSSTYGGDTGQDPLTGGPDPYGSPEYPTGQGYQEEGFTEGAHAASYTGTPTQSGYPAGQGDYTTAESPTYGSTYAPESGASAVTDDRPDVEDESVGSLIGRMTSNLSKLMRQEVELAKVEVREEVKKAGAAAGMLAAAGVAGLLLLICLSLTLIWLLDMVMYQWLAALIVTVLWGIVAAILALNGKNKLAAVNPKPEQTIETLKEDKEWVQAQRS